MVKKLGGFIFHSNESFNTHNIPLCIYKSRTLQVCGYTCTEMNCICFCRREFKINFFNECELNFETRLHRNQNRMQMSVFQSMALRSIFTNAFVQNVAVPPMARKTVKIS